MGYGRKKSDDKVYSELDVLVMIKRLIIQGSDRLELVLTWPGLIYNWKVERVDFIIVIIK